MANSAPPTMKEIAQRANVSVATVSRVLNNREYVRDDVRQRILAAMQEAGYEPDHIARSLRTKASFTVGFIVRDLLDLVFASMAQGADSTLAERGYTMLLSTSGENPKRDTARFSLLRQRRVDGFILAVSEEQNDELIAEMRKTTAPIVLVDREIAGSPVDSVVTDYHPGMLDAVAQLVSLGHRRIAYIGGDLTIRPGRERLSAIRAAWQRFDLPQDPALFHLGSFSEEFGYRKAHKIMTAAEPPTALIGGGNQVSVGALRAIRELGLSVPNDLSFVAVDDVDLFRVGSPPISVISRPLVEIGVLAANRILDRLSQPAGAESGEPVQIVVPTRFEQRESCAAPAR
jgi:LacI family transcriptional regulator